MRVSIKLFFTLFLLFTIFSHLPVSADSADSVTTRVVVVEGMVICFDLPKDFAEIAGSRETAIGVFLERINEESGKVDVNGNTFNCYIPLEYRDQISDSLLGGSYVYLARNIRRLKQTEWDIITVGKVIGEGYEYIAGAIEQTPEVNTIAPAVPTLMVEAQETGEAESGETTNNTEESIGEGEGEEEEPEPAPVPPTPPPEPEPPAPTPTPTGPTASISATPSMGTPPLAVSFDGSGSTTPNGTITAYSWDFGDSNTNTGATTSNTYTVIGTYTVTLTVTDTSGLTDSATTTITVSNTPSFYYVDPVNGRNGNDGSSSTPWQTIGYAVGNADSSVATTIYLAAGTYSAATGELFPILIRRKLTLDGDSATTTIIDGNSSTTNRIFSIPNTTVTIRDLTVRNSISGGGVGISNNSTVTMINCIFSNNSASNGGAISIDSATATLTSCTINNNSSTDNLGGGVNANSSNLTLNACTFSSNTSATEGGGLNFGGDSGPLTLTINDSSFSANTSGINGGAINISGTGAVVNAIIRRSEFFANSATTAGSAIFSRNANTTLATDLIFANTFSDAVQFSDTSRTTTTRMINCTLYGNGVNGINTNTSTLIRNNIIAANTNNGIVENSVTNPQIDNNCLSNNTTNAAFIDGVGYPNTPTGITNLNTALALSAPNLNIGINPQFKDVTNTNFHLSASTPAAVADGGTTTAAPSGDMDSRPYEDPPSIGCYQYYTGDPPITVRAYDAVSGATISGSVIAIFNAGSNSQLAVTTSNPHTFNVVPGSYYLAVSKDGYGFPSEIAASTVSGDHGDIFVAGSEPLTIDIPLDPDGWLVVEKKCNKKRVEAGDIVTYHITVKNNHWYEAVENVELTDQITNGLKYVDGSTLKNKSLLSADKIRQSNRKIIFDFGTVAARSTNTISYQVRVGSAIPPGRYKAAASTRKSTTLARNSNISVTKLEIVEDPLFTRGTIIGKVFWDMNANTVQDKGEPGVAGVRLATEYGVIVTTDELGKYHIADVPAGNHLVKVDSATFPEYATFTTDNPYFVKITEGLIAKANFGINLLSANEANKEQEETKYEVRSTKYVKNLLNKFFIVALGEGTVRNLNTSGNIAMVDKDDRYDDGVHVDGRLAFYLKGKVLGKYLVTASLDTDRRPFGRYDTRKLFTNLDPDKYYPVYGDASQVDYSATDTQDIGYVLIEWDESFAKWGSFNTELPLYNRSLSGGIVNFNSVGKTKFGVSKTKIKGFGAYSRQKPAHDEFVGTGGSLYYLRHDEVIEGSEKLRVEVRDRIGKITSSSVPLFEEKDYEIDYDRGRIILKKPLNGIQQSYNESIISNDILAGSRVYLVVDYEYYSDGLSEQSWGANGSQWIGNHVRVGGVFVEEQKPGDNYQLAGGDATIRIDSNTDVNVYYNRTENTQLGSAMSYDGGLSFNSQGDEYSKGKSGSAVGVNGRTRLFNNTDIYLSYTRQDPFYSVSNSISSQGSQKYLANVVTRLTDTISCGVKHITQRYFEGTVAESIFGATDSHTTTATVDYRRDKWDLRGEYQHQTVKNPITDYTYFGTLPLESNDFLAARVGYQLFKWLHAYVRGQATVRGDTNNQGTVGADIAITEKTQINLAETVGTLGNSTLVGITSKITEGTDVYANLEVGNHMKLGKYTKTTYGQSTYLCPDSRIYVEEDYSSYRENLVRGNVVGYNRQLSDTLALGLSYERSYLKRHVSREAINRDSGSVSLAWLDKEFLSGIELSTKLECRNDRGTSVVRQWFTANDLICRLTRGLTVSGRGNYGWTENRTNNTDEAEFYELGTGFSFRPATWDRLNILGKYSYLTNLPPDSQYDFPETMDSRKNVYALEGIFDLCRYIQLVGKVAYRDMKEKVGLRDWTHSDTYLYLGRTNFHIVNCTPDKPFLLRGWDLGIEYRILRNTQIEDSKEGFLVELDKDLGNYLRFGVGYNFTDYSDDLRKDDNWDAKGLFVRVNGKY